MTKTYSAYEARKNFGELLNLVYYKDIEVIVEKMGKPVVKISKIKTNKKESREELIAKYSGIWKDDPNIDKIEKEMLKFRKNFNFTSS